MIAEARPKEAPVARPCSPPWPPYPLQQRRAIGAASDSRPGPAAADGLDEVGPIFARSRWPSLAIRLGVKGISLASSKGEPAHRTPGAGPRPPVALDTSFGKIVPARITDVTTPRAADKLFGQLVEKFLGQDHATLHDVATPHMIRQLPAGSRSPPRRLRPVIGRLPRAWRTPLPARPPPRPSPRKPAAGAPVPGPSCPHRGIPDHVPSEWVPPADGLPPLGTDHMTPDPITAGCSNSPTTTPSSPTHHLVDRHRHTLREHQAALERSSPAPRRRLGR